MDIQWTAKHKATTTKFIVMLNKEETPFARAVLHPS
jgi:hypothetical protein